MRAGARVLVSELDGAEARRRYRIPRKRLLPTRGDVGQPVEARAVQFALDSRDVPDYGTAADRIGQLRECCAEIVADSIVLCTGFHQAIVVASLEVDANRADRVVVRHREGSTLFPGTIAPVEAKHQFVLQALGQDSLDCVL